MEKVMSVEDKIRRAEEIYERRKQGKETTVAKVKIDNKKDFKLLRKIIIQILVCTSIYLIISTINNSQYIFAEDFIKKTNEILNYDINFNQIYENLKNTVMGYVGKYNSSNKNENNDSQAIGGAQEENQKIENVVEEQKTEENTTNNTTETTQTSSEVKFIKPLEGEITSKYGQRETNVKTVPKNHTGTDIAAPTGTKIISSTDGEVVLASEEGDYR